MAIAVPRNHLMPETFVIGDIHGALKALKQVIARVAPKNEDRLIFLGDYVDGWSESAQVIEYLTGLARDYSCIFIKGNHDAWCEDWLKGGEPDPNWLIHGGKATIESYKNKSQAEKEVHLEFFKGLKYYYEDDKNRLFIHAGFSAMRGPEFEHYTTNFYWDRTLWEMALTMDKQIEKGSNLYPKRLLLYSEIYIGHTPTTNYGIDTPMHACNVWNVDTGAAFNGKLSALNIESKAYFQSDTVQDLYPTEKGRNK